MTNAYHTGQYRDRTFPSPQKVPFNNLSYADLTFAMYLSPDPHREAGGAAHERTEGGPLTEEALPL